MNDTFSAPATSTTTGLAATSVNSGDSIDGGTGTDTLTITATAANNSSLSGLTVKGVENIVIVGSDNLATLGTGTAAVAAGTAEVDTFTFATAAAASAAIYTVTVNGVAYAGTVAGGTTNANALTAITSAFTNAFGSSTFGSAVTVAVSSQDLTVTSRVAGVAIPSYTLTAGTGGIVIPAKVDTTANLGATAVTPTRQVLTFTPGDPGGTATYATTDTYKVIVNGVTYTTAPAAAATATAASTTIAATLNAILGAGTAVAGGEVVVMGPADGSPLPSIGIIGASSTAEGTLTVSAAPVKVGAAPSTITTAASVAATQFTNATSIAVDGAATTVTALTTQSVTLSGASMSNTLKYSAAATAANIVLSGASGTVTITDNISTAPATALGTVNLTGTVKNGAAAGVNTIATNGAVTIDETANGTSDFATVLNVGITGTGADLTISGLSKLKTFDASTSTGNITATTASTVNNVKGGTGNDALTIGVVTDVNSTTGLTSAAIDSGAGNDTITVAAAVANGTGPITITGNAGTDTVDVRLSGITNQMSLAGGDGTDTLRFAGATAVSSNAQTLTAAEYALANAQAANGFETIRLAAQALGNGTALTATDTISIDASKLSGFSTLRFDSAASVTKLADNQAVTGVQNITAQATNYIAKGSAAAATAGLTATQYGGALTINASGSSKTVTALSDSVTLNVSNIPDSSLIGTFAVAASTITLTGDAKTATINLISATNYAKGPTSDIISTVTLTPADTGFASAYSAMGNLTSVVLKGVGAVTLNNSDKNTTNNPIDPTDADTLAGSKLVTIDASGLGGTKGTYDTANVGKPLGGLTYTGNVFLAETVTLGAGQDSLTFNSTYDKMDTIIGFRLVGNSDLTLNTTYSDDVAQDAGAVAVKNGLTATTLSGVLAQVAALGGATSTYAEVVFQFGGDTYYFKESSASDTALSNNDIVVKFVGLYDLDLLVLAFAAA